MDGYADELCEAIGNVRSEKERESLTAKVKDLTGLAAELDTLGVFDATSQVALLWSVPDVTSLRHDLTNEQAMRVLEAVKARHDCTNGVTWDTLTATADEFFPRKNITDPFLRLLSHAYEPVELERRVNGCEGIRVRCLADGETLYEEDDSRHAHHAGHKVVVATYGDPAEVVCVSIECEDCSEVIVSLEKEVTK